MENKYRVIPLLIRRDLPILSIGMDHKEVLHLVSSQGIDAICIQSHEYSTQLLKLKFGLLKDTTIPIDVVESFLGHGVSLPNYLLTNLASRGLIEDDTFHFWYQRESILATGCSIFTKFHITPAQRDILKGIKLTVSNDMDKLESFKKESFSLIQTNFVCNALHYILAPNGILIWKRDSNELDPSFSNFYNIVTKTKSYVIATRI